MDYEELQPLDRAEVERLVASDDADVVCRAVVSASLHDSQGDWVERLCLRLLSDPRDQVRGCALTSLGHLARVRGLRDRQQVVVTLTSLLGDPVVGGRAGDALSDIRIFGSEPKSD
jgi:hypothetical protein